MNSKSTIKKHIELLKSHMEAAKINGWERFPSAVRRVERYKESIADLEIQLAN